MKELTDDDRIQWGVHRGKRLADVPPLYYDWMRDQPWLHEKYPALEAYIKRNEKRIDKLIEEGRG